MVARKAGITTVEIRSCKFWIEPNRLGTIGYRLVGLGLRLVSGTTPGERISILWIEPDRLAEIGDGTITLAPGKVDVSAIDEGLSILWIDANQSGAGRKRIIINRTRTPVAVICRRS
jgi:hypothetical protein